MIASQRGRARRRGSGRRRRGTAACGSTWAPAPVSAPNASVSSTSAVVERHQRRVDHPLHRGDRSRRHGGDVAGDREHVVASDSAREHAVEPADAHAPPRRRRRARRGSPRARDSARGGAGAARCHRRRAGSPSRPRAGRAPRARCRSGGRARRGTRRRHRAPRRRARRWTRSGLRRIRSKIAAATLGAVAGAGSPAGMARMPCTSPCIRKKSGSALENTTTRAGVVGVEVVEQPDERADERAVDQVGRRVVDHDLGDARRHLAAQRSLGHRATPRGQRQLASSATTELSPTMPPRGHAPAWRRSRSCHRHLRVTRARVYQGSARVPFDTGSVARRG